MANNEIKDFEKLIIYIKNKEYSKDKVFLKDKILYTTISSLAKMIKFNYSYEKRDKSYILKKKNTKVIILLKDRIFMYHWKNLVSFLDII